MGQQEDNWTLGRIKSEKSYNLINIVQNGKSEHNQDDAIEEILIDQNQSPVRCTSRDKKKKRLNNKANPNQ